MARKLYGSVGGQSKEIKNLYGSINGASRQIVKLYGSAGGVSKLIYQSITPPPTPSLYGVVYYKANSSSSTVLSVELQSVAECNSLGSEDDDWTASIGGGSVTVSNNSTNIIVGIDIGTQITTIPDGFLYCCSAFNQPLEIPNTVTSIGEGFMGECDAFNQTITLSNSLTSIGDGFMDVCTSFNQPLTLPSSLTSIGNFFMVSCTAFNQSLTIPSSVTSIGGSFLAGCTAFNQPLTIPNSVTSIGANFMDSCSSFNQSLTLPSSLTSIGTYFLYNCNSMTNTVNVGSLAATIATSSNRSFATTSSSAACYTTGITIAGANASAWISRFPNRTSSPYRKLINEPQYGIVYYKTNASDPDSEIKSVELQSLAEFNSLSGILSWTATVGGGTVTVSNYNSTNVIVGLKIGKLITSLPNNFLGYCTSLTMPLDISNITAIGAYFLSGCSSFNQPLTFSNSLTTIGEGFLSVCSSFNQSVVLPSSITSIGKNFMSTLRDMTGTVNIGSLSPTVVAADTAKNLGSFCAESNVCATFTTGITIVGANVDAWRTRFPNSQNVLYRNLLGGTVVTVPYGTVYYKANANSSQILSVELQSVAEFNSLGSEDDDWTASIGGGSVTVSNNSTNIIVGIDIGTQITSTPTCFLAGCEALDRPVILPDSITLINDAFLINCLYFNQPVVLSNSLTSTGHDFMASCQSFDQPLRLPNSITSIGDGFMAFCFAFNQSLILPSSLVTIGDEFLQTCRLFNQPLLFGTNLTTIGESFLYNCEAFNQPLTLWLSSITSIGTWFLYNCKNMTSVIDVGSLGATVAESSIYSFATNTSSAACYTTGITIMGTNRAAWFSRFPNRTSNPYRKLLDLGF